jgi:hypothetical protein
MKIQTPFQQFKEKYFKDSIDSNGNVYIILEEWRDEFRGISMKSLRVNVLEFYNKFHEFQELPIYKEGFFGFKVFKKIK